MTDHYTYRVFFSAEDGEWVGTCEEFPSLSHLDRSKAAALHGIEGLVRDVVDDMSATGEPVPEPLGSRTYSGKFQTRVSSHLHRALVMEASVAGVSLNTLVATKLATPLTAMPLSGNSGLGPGPERSVHPARRRAPGKETLRS